MELQYQVFQLSVVLARGIAFHAMGKLPVLAAVSLLKQLLGHIFFQKL